MIKGIKTAVRSFALLVALCATGGAWAATLVAEWGPGDFPVSAAGSAAVSDDDGGSGLTISKNNAANVSTANGIIINGYPATLIPGSGTTVKTVVIGYKVKSATTAGTIVGFGVDSNSNNIRQNLNILSDGKLCFGWADTYDWGESHSAQLNKNQPNDGEVHFVTFAYAGNTTSGTTFWFDGANKVNKSNLGAGTFTRIGDITLGGVRGPANCFSGGGIEFVYVAAYNDVLSNDEAVSTFKTARAAVYAASVTPVVDESNNAVFTVTDDASYFVDSATTYNSITFDVSAGKTLKLFGNTLTGTSGITVNGGTVKLISANTQLSGALAGTGTVAYPAGTLPSGVTYSATWTGTIWVKGIQGNQARNFDAYGQGTSKVKISGITGYLDSNPTITFSRELVLDDDTYGFAMKLGNGNSPGNNDSSKNRCAIFKKLSGDGTFTAGGSTGGYGGSSWPVIRIIDSSEFTGTINCQVESGAQLGGVIFSEEGEEMPDSMYNMFISNTRRIFVSAGCTVANGNAVTVPAGKTWVAQSGIDVRGDLIVNGTLNATIVNNAGSITVNPGATVSTQGSKRDFTGWIVADGASISITQTAEEYGKGVTTVTGAENVSSITVLDPYGEVAGTITPAISATLNTAVKTSGKACWCDYEMNGNLDNAGTDTIELYYDQNMNAGNSFYNSQMLYTYTHPYRGVTYPSTWTAVVRCTVPKVANGAVITFGTCTGGLIGLIAGDDPETEMKLIKTTGNSAYTTLATMPIVNGTTAQHVYVFVVENNSTVKVYCDGSEVLNQTYSAFTLGGGIQVGSVHGGVYSTGITRVWKNDTYAGLTEDDLKEARIDCVRLYKYSLSAEQIAALSDEFPAMVVYRATAAANTDTTWTEGTLSWSPAWTGGNDQSKVILTTEGDARISLPDTITADQLQFSLAADSTLTLAGPGSITVTEPVDITGGTLELTGTMTLTQDTAFNGTVKFAGFTKAGNGAIKLSNGSTVSVDAALVVTPLGTYTCAEGTVVDSSYTGEGVKLMPLASAVASITQGGTTLYYSNILSAFAALMASTYEAVVFTLLTGDVDSETATTLQGMGYYVSGNTVTRAVAKIVTTTYASLADAIVAAENGDTVVLLRASSEAITLNKAITLSETANFSGTLTGNGTLTFATFRNNPTITFTDWTGTVALPEFAANGTILNKYGVTGSTVVLNGITGGWLGETSNQKMDVYPVLQLDGDVTITGFSTSWDYTFAEITGTGTFSLDPTDNHPYAASITKVAEGFTGTIYSDINSELDIGELNLSSLPACDAKVLSVDGSGVIGLDVSDIKVNSVALPAKYKLKRSTDGDDGDGFYVYYYGTLFMVY